MAVIDVSPVGLQDNIPGTNIGCFLAQMPSPYDLNQEEAHDQVAKGQQHHQEENTHAPGKGSFRRSQFNALPFPDDCNR